MKTPLKLLMYELCPFLANAAEDLTGKQEQSRIYR